VQVFLHAVREDAPRAEAHYRQALMADPAHANNLSNFGLFLSDVQHDASGAEACYEAALAADPAHANAKYNYAVREGKLIQNSFANEGNWKSAARDP
jgi:Tfp pilus assembly protein PilF